MQIRGLLSVFAIATVAVFAASCSTDAKPGPTSTTGDTRLSDRDRPNPSVSWRDFTNPDRNGYSDRVFFAFDRHDLDERGRATIRAWSAWLKAHRGARVLIEGHADERGTREYNLALGARRATAVREYLIALGVAGGRVRTISYGKERPAVAGSDEDAWAKNRRGVAKPSESGA